MRHMTLRASCAAFIMLAGLTAAHADTYAVLVGINDYQYFGVRDLQYSESDVALMRDTLIQHCDVPPDHIRVLLGKEATRRAIGLAIRVWLAENAGPDDRALFYFAGHGTQLQDDNGDEEDGLDESLWAWDTGILDLTWVRDDDLNRWLSAVPAREKVVILDCCHSGTGSRFLGENRVRAASVPMSEVRITSLETKLEAERAIEAEASAPASSPADMSAFTTPGAGDAVSEFSACLPHQLVVETAQYKHGALTYFLTEGLRGAADDDADGVITLGELQAYSARRIQEHGFPQEPQLYGAEAPSFALVEGPPQAMRGASDATATTPDPPAPADDSPDAWAAPEPTLQVALDANLGGPETTGGVQFARVVEAVASVQGVRVGGDAAPDIVVMATPNDGPAGGIVVRTANPLTGESGAGWEISRDSDVAACADALRPVLRAAAVRKALLAIQNVDSPRRIRQSARAGGVELTTDAAGVLLAVSVADAGAVTVSLGADGSLTLAGDGIAPSRRKAIVVTAGSAPSRLTAGAVIEPEAAWQALKAAIDELAALPTDAWGASAILAEAAARQ
ncbi:hypothetical protein CMK11_21720 [Candidatus Poribacteria bacterium]|nr:hypothetical protein [Candidatus Poribacteria bacterium]